MAAGNFVNTIPPMTVHESSSSLYGLVKSEFNFKFHYHRRTNQRKYLPFIRFLPVLQSSNFQTIAYFRSNTQFPTEINVQSCFIVEEFRNDAASFAMRDLTPGLCFQDRNKFLGHVFLSHPLSSNVG